MIFINSEKNKNYLIDGKKVFNCTISERTGHWIGEQPAVTLTLHNKEDFEYILRKSSDLEPRIYEFGIESYVNWGGINIEAGIDIDERWFGHFIITLKKNWSWSFTPREYFTEFARVKGSKVVEAELEEHKNGFLVIKIFPNSNKKDRNAFPAFSRGWEVIKKYHDEAINRLMENTDRAKVTLSFDFPEEIKSSCEQYLLYFAKFLKDLGIDAISNLKEDAGNVLFSVIPNNDIEALDKIREALAVYLSLPSSPIVYDESFAAMRLQQQVENLQHSQRMAEREIRAAQKELLLAEKVIESQDEIIFQKNATIEQQSKIIERITSKSIMIDSLENKEELEEIFEGLKIGKSKFLVEQFGIHLNPATVIKTAVNKFTRKDDDKNSVLGFEETDKKDS